jgi:hypothetical protein
MVTSPQKSQANPRVPMKLKDSTLEQIYFRTTTLAQDEVLGITQSSVFKGHLANWSRWAMRKAGKNVLCSWPRGQAHPGTL